MTKKKKGEIESEVVEEFDDEDFFDDCPICQAMKEAKKRGKELTLEELKGTFQKAKEKGGIVSGEWFENSREGE